MTSPHQLVAWEQVRAVFLGAIDLPEEARAEWLDQACAGNDALRREVDSLLASDREATAFCETPAAAMPGSELAGLGRRLARGSHLGSYEIGDFIDAGGMGEVYRAKDLRDGRDVAIKIVSAALATPAGELRLLREARHAATLSHPNICAIREVGSDGSIPFIAMQLVDGRPLSAVQGDQPLSVDRALRYGIQVADALDHAHAHDVIHRDLKRSNIVIDGDDRAMVLDFGLAKQLAERSGDASLQSLTASGHTPPGTLSHMAPEVLRGLRADARADVWGLGVLLYELLTGALPFSRRTPFETSSAILADRPARMPRSIPLALRLIVARCLEKSPARRYRRAADVRDALSAVRDGRGWRVSAALGASSRAVQRRAAGAAAAGVAIAAAALLALRLPDPPIAAIAVMPIAHASGPDDAAYAAGMTDAIAAQLGASARVRVLSAASLRDAADRPIEGGRALGADAIVTGTLVRTSGTIGLDLRLVDTGSGETRWSRSFARAPREVLVLQADAVRELAGRIHAVVTPAARERLTLVPSIRPEVYEAYLRGRYEWNQRTPASLRRAVAHFEQAIALDPAYAPAYARLADCYNQMGTVLVGVGSPRVYRPLARAAAVKALQIDPGLAEAHATLGYVQHYSWEWAEAEQSFRRAIEINPSAPLPHLWYANLLMSKARWDEALREAHVARDLDPFSLVVHTNIGWILFTAGRLDESIEALRKAVSLDPSYPQAHWRLADALQAAGRYDEARKEVDEVVRLTNRSPGSRLRRAELDADIGRTAEARRTLAAVRAMSGAYVASATMTALHVRLGEFDAALDWMERAADEGSNAAAYFAVEPTLRPLRDRPRYRALLGRTGLDGVDPR